MFLPYDIIKLHINLNHVAVKMTHSDCKNNKKMCYLYYNMYLFAFIVLNCNGQSNALYIVCHQATSSQFIHIAVCFYTLKPY